MNNCSYCTDLAVSRCISCSEKLCDEHISDHVKDFKNKHEIVSNLFKINNDENLRFKKKCSKRILVLLKLKGIIMKTANHFIEEISALCAASIRKIDEKLRVLLEMLKLKFEFNYSEYQCFIKVFETRIKPEMVKMNDSKKYFSQNVFSEILKKNVEFRPEFEYLDNEGDILTINATTDQNIFYGIASKLKMLSPRTKSTVGQSHVELDITNSIYIPELNAIVAAHINGHIVVWDIPLIIIKIEKQIHSSNILGLAMSFDNKYIVSSSNQGPIKITNLENLITIKEIETSIFIINCLAITNNIKYIVSGTRQNKLVIWNYNNSLKDYELSGHSHPIICLLISNDDNYIVSGSEDKMIKIWDFNLMACIFNLEGHTDHVTSLKFSLDNRYIISGSKDCTVRVWNFIEKKCQFTLIGHNGNIYKVEVSTDGKWVYSCSSDKTIKGWKIDRKVKLD